MISTAKYIKDYIIEIKFNNGKSVMHDFEPEIKKSYNGLILEFLDVKKFRRMKVDNGSLVWRGNNFDVHGSALYEAHFGRKKKLVL